MWKYGSASSSASFGDRKADWFDSFLSRDRSHLSSISASSFEMAVSVYAWFTFITQEKGKWSANGTHCACLDRAVDESWTIALILSVHSAHR